ncbi:MAG: amino acid permease [Thermoleophilaceae bacterium]
MAPARGRVVRGLGAPALFAVAMSSVGASVYFVLGLVAGEALGLTPVVFLVAGAFLVLATMTYVEGSSVHPERGGAATFARYAFDELWSFVAGWAILLDFVIVMAVAAVSIAHYLALFWAPAGQPPFDDLIAVAAIGWVAWVNVRGVSANRLGMVTRLAVVNLLLLSGVVVAGIVTLGSELSLAPLDAVGTPSWEDLVFAAVVATVAVTGIEAASGLAGEIRPRGRELRRVVVVIGLAVVLVLTGVAVVALAAAPDAGGLGTLAGAFARAPLLGVVAGIDPPWLAETLATPIAFVGALVLLQAVNTNMLGVSRLGYSLTTNRQIPAALGRLHARRSTPWILIVGASGLALGLSVLADLEFLLGMFAFGSMLAFTIAHLSVIVLRFREPDAPRAYRVPLSVTVRGASVPLPAVVGALLSFAAWVSVLALHEGARYAGLVWMAVGLVLYVAYRRRQGESLTRRVSIPASVLREFTAVEYGSILVPVFGRPLDDDIVGTAGRLAAEDGEEGEGGPMIEALYVIEMPMSLPIDARVSDDQVAAAKRALARAKEVGEEDEGVEVATVVVRGRSPGATIVAEARRRGVEAIVLAAEEPTRVRGGTRLGGRGGPSDRFIGEMTKYVVEKAPCRVVLTAPAHEEAGGPRGEGGNGRAPTAAGSEGAGRG